MMLALGRLLRLSLAPTALADIAAGIVLAAGAWPAGIAPFVLLAASAAVYHGGMALNDWADRDADRHGRPERPIPSGAVSARGALGLSVALLLAGPALALRVSVPAGILMGGVACLAAFYDLRGRGAGLGPLLLAGCRAGNLGAGMLFGHEHGSAAVPLVTLVTALILYGGYVGAVSGLARLEEEEPARLAAARPGVRLRLAALCLGGLGAVPLLVRLGSGPVQPSAGDLGPVLGALLACAGALGLVRSSRRVAWDAPMIQSAVGAALRRLLVATSALACQARGGAGLVVAGLILLGYPLSRALRRVFPPT